MTQVFMQWTYHPDIATAVDGQHVVPYVHRGLWIRYWSSTGTNPDGDDWKDYEECWCGVTREMTVSKP